MVIKTRPPAPPAPLLITQINYCYDNDPYVFLVTTEDDVQRGWVLSQEAYTLFSDTIDDYTYSALRDEYSMDFDEDESFDVYRPRKLVELAERLHSELSLGAKLDYNAPPADL